MTTPTVQVYFSDFFGVHPDVLDKYGAFDISLIGDLPLFIDPFLLFNSPNKTYVKLHDDIIGYMRFLKKASQRAGLADGLLHSWFTFPEVRQNWLGYSENGNAGHGLGRDFAAALQRNFRLIFSDFGSETITRGSHIEKLCLIRDGVGRDNLSDFTVNLIKGYLASYTQELATKHIDSSLLADFALERAAFNYKTGSWATRTYRLPSFDNDYVLLTPKDMLTRDDTWISRADLLQRLVGIANSLPNTDLRDQVNDYLIRVLPTDPKASQNDVNVAMSLVIDEFPDLLDYYILKKEDEGDQAVSVARLRVGVVERLFVAQVRDLVLRYLEPEGFYRIRGDTYHEALERIRFLKDVVENKGGHRLFYVDGAPVRRESDLHILYRLTWYGTPSDVSREVNDGRGPADFGISRGAKDKTLVEFKLASNTQLARNLKNQTTVYEAASGATNPSIKVIFFFSEKEKDRTTAILEDLGLKGSPNVVLVDARNDNKPSGSRA